MHATVPTPTSHACYCPPPYRMHATAPAPVSHACTLLQPTLPLLLLLQPTLPCACSCPLCPACRPEPDPPAFKLGGMAIGNGFTDAELQTKVQAEVAYNMGLINWDQRQKAERIQVCVCVCVCGGGGGRDRVGVGWGIVAK